MLGFGRARAKTGAADGEEWPEDDAELLEPVAPRRSPARVADGAGEDEIPSSRLRGNEILYGYLVGGLLVVASAIMLVVTKGAGAPAHPQPLWPALGLVFGVATLVSIRFGYRLVTALAAMAGGLVLGQARLPNSVAAIRLVAMLAPVIYGFLVFRRQSKADRARRMEQARTAKADRAARRNGKGSGKDEYLPGHPKPSARYTPPKAKRTQR